MRDKPMYRDIPTIPDCFGTVTSCQEQAEN